MVPDSCAATIATQRGTVAVQAGWLPTPRILEIVERKLNLCTLYMQCLGAKPILVTTLPAGYSHVWRPKWKKRLYVYWGVCVGGWGNPQLDAWRMPCLPCNFSALSTLLLLSKLLPDTSACQFIVQIALLIIWIKWIRFSKWETSHEMTSILWSSGKSTYHQRYWVTLNSIQYSPHPPSFFICLCSGIS